MKARIRGLTLDGVGDTDSPYTVTSIDGWDDGVETRREAQDRPSAHGQYPTAGFLSGRLITISGEIYTEPAKQDHTILRLSGLLARGDSDKLTVDMDGTTQWARVQRNGAPDITRDRWGLLATYQLQLWAVDPRKYGDVHEYAAGQPAAHYGNFEASPRLLIGAGTGGYTITTDTGRQIIVGTAPAAAHEIDLLNGGLFLDGVRQFGAITVYQPWTVGPGLGNTVTASITGTRTLMQQVTDTFV